MKRQPVRSSMLASVGYDQATAILEVAFVEGGIYQYFDVPSDVYVGLMAASSHGTYFDAYVKQAGYRYAKVE
jgi:KTSC domain